MTHIKPPKPQFPPTGCRFQYTLYLCNEWRPTFQIMDRMNMASKSQMMTTSPKAALSGFTWFLLPCNAAWYWLWPAVCLACHMLLNLMYQNGWTDYQTIQIGSQSTNTVSLHQRYWQNYAVTLEKAYTRGVEKKLRFSISISLYCENNIRQ